MNLNRRDFLKFCGRLALAFCGNAALGSDFAEAFIRIARKEVPVIWLTGQACSGDSVSLVYGDSPSLVPILTNLVDLKFHPVLSVAQGEMVLQIIEEVSSKGQFVLCFEGAIPTKMPEACTVAEQSLIDLLERVIVSAAAVIACGTCASYGGIPRANPETGAVSIFDFVKERGLGKPVVRIPGCPMNSLRFTGTVAYFVAYGKLPPLDKDNRPLMYYEDIIHHNCQRYQYFVQDLYATDYNQKKFCLFRMGCRGPVTRADCPLRRWNGGTSWCVAANTPCVGCAHPDWPWGKEEGFYPDPARIVIQTDE
ncbi:hydrogenase small subunit [Thermosulfuriphilus sp.]